MITHTSNLFTLGAVKAGPDDMSPAPSPNTDDIVSQGVADIMRRAGRNVALAKNLSSVEDGIEPSPTAGEMAADPPASSIPSLPGQGYTPTAAPVSEESPVVRPQDIKQIDGEGNMQDASSAVNDMEQGGEPSGADGGDSSAVGEFSRAMDSLARQSADVFALPEPSGLPYENGMGNPSSDPLTAQAQAMPSSGASSLFDDAIASITPPDAATVLRPPTLTGGEIGGRITDEGDSGI